MNNPIQAQLSALGICDERSISQYYPRVRDRDDINVLKCQKSGVIFLSSSDHINLSHYEKQNDFSYWGALDRQAALQSCSEDNNRRAHQFKELVMNRKWVDIGTGAGGILDLLGKHAKTVCAVEPQADARKSLQEMGYNVFETIDNIPFDNIDTVTLFHVFEHFTAPLESLVAIRSKMTAGGKIVIEVPHANDFLLSKLNIESFKAFTFWSEHLILHTPNSLKTFLEKAGFKDINISGFQRYSLANHLYWLAKSKPGGHNEWHELRTPELDAAYSNMLAGINATDTLIAIASV
ncbi:MAG: class I SAM-dependent methyltransferase [Paraglaciecola sp.]|uniref:class I SAM-dependent methyltransferase n=1 Tax=Paraglaciecola sp. TaxID=1920173 RepID=UPI00329A2143